VQEQVVQGLRRRAANLAKAIALAGEEIPSLVQELVNVQEQLRAAEARQQHPAPAGILQSGLAQPALAAQLGTVLPELARTSYELGDLLRRLIPDLVIQPVQSVDGFVRPRAQLTISLATLAEPGGSRAGYIARPGDFCVALDLFEPPAHIRHRIACLTEKARNPKLSLKQIGARLGVNHMVVKRAFDYERRMQQAGWTTPYCELTACPIKASRWGSRRQAPGANPTTGSL
jgi:hypothetical protein